MERSLTLALFVRRGNSAQNLMKQYSLVDLLVLKMKIILAFGLLLHVEKDKRMRPPGPKRITEAGKQKI